MGKVIVNSKEWFSLENLEGEEWKDVIGYEGIYAISSEGRVKRLERNIVDNIGRQIHYQERILKYYVSKSTGYPNVNLSKNGEKETINIHSLIADAFIPNPDNLPCINHIDEDRSNSILSNLERCTYLYNNTYGLAKQKRRTTYLEKNSKIPICQYKKNGELVYIFKGGLKEVDEKYHSIFKYIRQCLNKDKASAGGFVWLFEGEIFGYKDKPYYRIPVEQYDLDGNLIQTFEGGLEEIKNYGEFDVNLTRACLNGKCKTSQGFVWIFKGKDFSYKRPLPPNKGRMFKNTKPKTHQKYVLLVDDNGMQIKRYKSVSEAAIENGFDRHVLSRKAVNGEVFVNGKHFIIERKENEYIPRGHKGPRQDLKGKGAKPISQYTKEGKHIQDFDSAIEAAAFLGKKYASNITNCCKGILKTAHGYTWTYKGAKEPRPFVNGSVRRVEQYAITGEYIATYNSIKESATTVGNGKPGSIANNLKGISKSAFGYIWKYANE